MMMFGETALLISSSLFIFCSYFELRHRAGYALFHIILCAVSCIRSFRWTEGIQGLELRPFANDGMELGTLLLPMVLTSQLFFGQKIDDKKSTDLQKSYLLAAQVMSMSTVSILLLLNRSKRFISFFILFLVTTCIAATINIHWDANIIRLVVWLVFYLLLLFLLLWVFPRSFSMGEAMVLVQSVVLFGADSWIHLRAKLFLISSSFNSYEDRSLQRPFITYWTQILVIGSLITGVLLMPVFYYLSLAKDELDRWIGTLVFYAVIFLSFLSFLLPWSILMLDGLNPFTWVLAYIFRGHTRVYLLLYWFSIVCLSLGVVAWKSSSTNDSTQTVIIRKYFHLLSIAIYLPGIILDPDLTHLASSVAMAAFIFIEYVRLGRIKPFGEAIHSACQVFLDAKDAGGLILTHIYLLIGCSIPLWLYPKNYGKRGQPGCKLVLYSGILSLGIGDTMASVIGKKFGRHRWPGSQKTVEGTIGGILSQLLFICVLYYAGHVTISDTQWLPVSLAVTVGSLLEAWTSQIDNVILPPFLYSLLLHCC